MPDYIPAADADFGAWLDQFSAGVQAEAAALGLTAAEADALNTARQDWHAAYQAHLAASNAAEAARQHKDDTREEVETRVRGLARRIQSQPGVSDAQRERLGLTVRDTVRTAAPVPTTRPVVVVASGQRLQHTLRWRDEATPDSRAKPPGVRGAEIWCAVGPTPPPNPAQYRFLALDTDAPHLVEHAAADAGQMAHYLVRWVNTRGQPGPWSETVSATIGA